MAIVTIDLTTPAGQEAVKTYIKEILLRNSDTNILTDDQIANLHEQNTDTSVGGVNIEEDTDNFTLTGGTDSERVLTIDETNSLSNKTDKVLASENYFASFNVSGNIQNSYYSANNFESKLNNPVANGGLLSSTTNGIKSWLYAIDGGSF